MLLSAGGADLVAVHSGGGGYSGWMQSAGVSVVADGTQAAASRLRLALDLDSGLGVLRHAEAGYPEAAEAVTDSTAPGADAPPLTWLDVRPDAPDTDPDAAPVAHEENH
jgi:urocanate hydratase